MNRINQAQHETAQDQASLCQRYIALTESSGLSGRQAAAELGRPASFFAGPNSVLSRYRRDGVAGLIAERAPGATGDLTKQIEALPWFIKAAKFYYLISNTRREGGSVPEAIRRTISLPHTPRGWDGATLGRLRKVLGLHTKDPLPACPADLREALLAREKEGQPFVPERVARQLRCSDAVMQFARHETNFGLNYLSCPGSMRRWTNPETNMRERLFAGDFIEADDATPGIAVCVPWEEGGTPVADKFNVMLGRYQWLPFMDAAYDYVASFSYVIRPRSSYRKDDIAASMKGLCKTHGIPRQGFRFERGAWESNLVKNICAGLGTKLWTVHSPHNKVIEILFNRVWTKLAVRFPHADLGRFRGENETNTNIYIRCKNGHADPRRYFPWLTDVIAAFAEVVAEHNRSRVESRNYGVWVPEERWTEHLKQYPLARLEAETEWLFSPQIKEWTVRGMLVGGKVPLFEDFSVPFDFSAPFLPQYHGAKVRCHFDPAEPRCFAKLVLAEPFRGQSAGAILGDAQSVNETTGYARLVLGWGDDPATAGKLARQRAASFVRRETRGIMPGGKIGYSKSEVRDGIIKAASVEQNGVSISSASNEIEKMDIVVPPRPEGTDPLAIHRGSTPSQSRAERDEEISRNLEWERKNQHLFL